MVTSSFIRCGWLAAVLLLAGWVVSARAEGTSSVVLLNDAYATLAQADRDYKGHRVQAMKQIELALNELGGKISSRGKGREPQGTSDAQLRAARTLLQQATGELSGKSLKHVKEACNQVNVALDIR